MQRSRVIAAVLAASALVPLTQQVAAATPAAPTTDAANQSAQVPGIPVALKAYTEPLVPQAPVLPQPTGLEIAAEFGKLRQDAQLREIRRAEWKAKKRVAAKRERLAAKRKRLAAKRAAAKPDFVKPTDGRLTSGFGARWGTQHTGIDLANSLGTPIVAAADGEVVEAGPASGFGLWVQIKHDDGTITVYGHMYEFSVSVGQRVKAGEKIAEIGNNGQSTGPHLHFEVWQGGGTKVDPLGWLGEHGVNL